MDALINQIWGILLAEAIVGGLALIGIVAGYKRFVGTEFPAAMAGVNHRLDELHEDFEKLKECVSQMRRDVDRHSILLDDTRDRMRRSEERRPSSRSPRDT